MLVMGGCQELFIFFSEEYLLQIFLSLIQEVMFRIKMGNFYSFRLHTLFVQMSMKVDIQGSEP